MIALHDLDPGTPFLSQLADSNGGPVTIVNTFLAPEGQLEAVIEAWRQDSVVMKTKPGFVSAQLYQGIAGSHLLVNVAVWESAQSLASAFASPEFQRLLAVYPDGSKSYPHLVRPTAVAGVCVG
ncbi:antibiotic biosynthesis monooxygenase family protein [Nocardia salmonicida]|uniref:antibiotic biosynthesis monooxygenase family protein n=1 Tax=Nocardia salmonicida TaxID=53431 RepID=UPI0007C8482A|nr:antibiotic biosynthesis monooxygenase family protein [Nocardia salmonicida]